MKLEKMKFGDMPVMSEATMRLMREGPLRGLSQEEIEQRAVDSLRPWVRFQERLPIFVGIALVIIAIIVGGLFWLLTWI